MKKIARFIILALLVALTVTTSTRIYNILTDDFRIYNISYFQSYPAPYDEILNPSVITNLDIPEIHKILDQPYSYIGKGGQSYAFCSEDDQYVIKFCKFKNLRPSLWMIPLQNFGVMKNYLTKRIEKKKVLILGGLAGYKLAYNEMPEESGVVYMQLSPGKNLRKKIKVYDKLGLSREIDLDQTAFIIQKKGILFEDYIKNAVRSNDIPKAKEAIEKIFSLYMAEYSKGIFDRDHGVYHNTGFLGEKAFRVDFGCFRKKAEIRNQNVYKKDLELVAWRMDDWLRKTFPKYYQELSTFISEQYKIHTGETVDISKSEIKKFAKLYPENFQ